MSKLTAIKRCEFFQTAMVTNTICPLAVFIERLLLHR